MSSLFAPNYSSAKFPEPREFQNTAHEKLRQGFKDGHRCQLLMAPTGGGKCLGRDTPVLMADGTIKMVQDIRVGDKLIGPDGGIRNVLSVTSGIEELYRVTPKKGMSYVVNASHILSLKKTPGSDGIVLSDGVVVKKDCDVVNINVETFVKSNGTAKHCLKGWRSGAIEFHAESEGLLLEPYWLGCWLGDGHQNMPALSSPECKMVDEWKKTSEKYGYSITVIQGRLGDCPSWRIVSQKGSGGNPINLLTMGLDYYGLRKRKHIPWQYKTSSIEDRLKLIAGLIDSDGSLGHSGYDWISNREELANDFAFVCRSVGLSAYISKCTKRINSTGFEGQYWRVSVSGDCSIIPSFDKPCLKRKQKKRNLVHGISVEKIGVGDYYGFEIDGDHLFLLGDFTVTHNTYLGMRIIHEALQRGKKTIFVCDRTTLINQTSAVADSYGLAAHSIVQAGHWRFDSRSNFQIASVQTLARRSWPDADVIVVDEAHTQYKAWTEHIQNTDAVVIGLSATPFSQGLGRLFTNLINAATMNELTQSGVLVPMRVFSCTKINMEGAETSGGEWKDSAAAQRGMEIIGDVVTEWQKHAENRKTIIFGATIAHCLEMCRQFNESGIPAAAFTSDTTESERKELLDEFSKPDSFYRILLSVEALAKGFDVKDVGCVGDCRPLRKSLSTAIQMWGRGLRSSPETGKQDCILLDFSGNIIRFADDFSDVFYNGLESLDMGEKLDKTIRRDNEEKEESKCPSCGFSPFGKRCISCGYERQKQNLVDHLPGEMTEIMIGKSKLADDKKHLYEQVCTYTRSHGNPETARQRAWYLFQDLAGCRPSPFWKFEDQPNTQLTRNTLNHIKRKQIAFAKASQRRQA